ncbi:MAG: nucleoside 2-deoxyribosyltransferase [Rhodobacteraceae bacterium]|nr:nucleoside 2-deoxyribosyltransferase [Paracoccaceae bacterium]
MQKIYLAGPDVFLPDAIIVGRRKCELCRQYGFEGLFPFVQGADPKKIFRANSALMERADIGLFNLTPFRGPSADVGTIFELGLMYGMGKPIYGYTNNPNNFTDRVEASHGARRDKAGRMWDREGYEIEKFGLTDNLMIEEALRETGHKIFVAEQGATGTLASLNAFEKCLSKISREMV